MENSLCGVNNILYEQLQKLDDPVGLSEEETKTLIARSKSMAEIAKVIVANAQVQLEAMKFYNESKISSADVPDMLIPRGENDKKLALPGDTKQEKKGYRV